MLRRTFRPNFFPLTSRNPLSSSPFSSSHPKPSSHLDPSSTAHAIKSELGLQKYLSKVYSTTFLSLWSSFGVSYLCTASNIALTYPSLCIGLGGLGGFLSIFAFGLSSYQNKVMLDQQGKQFLTSVRSKPRKFFYAAFVGSFGIMMSPVLAKYFLLNPLLIPMAIGTSAWICVGSLLYALRKPKDSLLWLGGPLSGLLLSLVIMQSISGVSVWLYGPNLFSMLAFQLDIYLGSALFTAFVAYDTHAAVRNYGEGNADYLGDAMNMFLNYQNILVRVMEILRKIYAKK